MGTGQRRHRATFAAIASLALALTGCASDPQTGMANRFADEVFTPLHSEKRIMQVATVKWVVRPDASAFCKTQVMLAPNAIPLGCAMWDASKSICTIVTPTVTSHAVLGHELRHCFEGEFHR